MVTEQTFHIQARKAVTEKTLVPPKAKQTAAQWMAERFGRSQRHVCRLLKVDRNTRQYRRTTNIGESPFASVRLCTDASRRQKRVEGGAIIWRILRIAEQARRSLNAPELLLLVGSRVPFKGGRMRRPGNVNRDKTDQSERTAI